MSWLFRGRGSPSKGESPGSEKKASKPTKAHLGETSKFYYNEKLKRWCVEGEEGDEGESSDAGIAPPPMSRSVSQDYLPADDGRGQGESAATAMSGLNPLTSSSMPGSPRRGASLRQRYYDPGYIGTTKQGSEEDGSVGGSVPALSLPERPSFFGAGGHDAQQPGPGVPNNGGKIPITLFVPQTQDGTGQGGFDENNQVGEGEGNVNGGGGEVPAFSMPWGNETEASEAQSSNGVGALDEGSQQHQHEQDAAADGTAAETAEAAEEAAYPAPAVGLEAYGEDPLFPVQDQFAHLDYDQAKATYFEQKDQQAAYGGEARLDDLAGDSEPQLPSQAQGLGLPGDAQQQAGLANGSGDYNGDYYGGYNGGYGPAQTEEEGPNSEASAQQPDPLAADVAYNDGYDGLQQPATAAEHHQWHSLDMSQADSRAGEQSLDLSSYNSSYKDVASLDKAQQHLQRELDAMAEKLRDSESERERLRAELEMERERERAVASTSAGEEPAEPETPSAAGDAAAAGTPAGKATYSTIKRSLQEKIEELELNDLEKHKLLLENYRLQESLRQKDEELKDIQSDMNDLLVCLGQESAKVQALVPYAEGAGQDVETLLQRVEEESALEMGEESVGQAGEAEAEVEEGDEFTSEPLV